MEIMLFCFLLCGGIQGALAFLLEKRGWCAGLPVACIAALIYAHIKYMTTTGWNNFGWGFTLYFIASALAGILLGWIGGAALRKNRRPPPTSPKEDL